MLVAVGNAPVGEEKHDVLDALGCEADEVPVHVGVLPVRKRVPLPAVNHVRELHRVPDEEEGRVVADHVLDALFGVELDGEPSRVAVRVGEAPLTQRR